MKLQADIGQQSWTVHMPGHSIAIPLRFNGPQPNTYGVPAATSQAFEGSGFVGDTRRGSGCNFETYHFTPHCNGTHTECVGHITTDRISIHTQLNGALVPATLISIRPVAPEMTNDAYTPDLNPEDRIIDRASLEKALDKVNPEFLQAIVLRTFPNGESKQARDYMAEPPAFFTLEGMAYLAELGIQHLLVDMPSVDRLYDDGRLSAHHVFWNMDQGSKEPGPDAAMHRTITEMIFVPDTLSDGAYLLNLQVAAFVSDAAPSRPLLYSLSLTEEHSQS